MADFVQVDNAADPRQVREATKKTRRARDAELSDLRDLLRSAPGRRVLWRILEHCGVFRSIWDPGPLIHFNEGKRDVGLFLLTELTNADMNALRTMIDEAGAAALRDRVEREQQRVKRDRRGSAEERDEQE